MKTLIAAALAATALTLAGCGIPKSQTSPETPAAKPVAQGVPVQLGALRVNVTNTWQITGATRGHWPSTGGVWVEIDVRVDNTGYDSASFDPMMQTFVVNGRRYNADMMASGHSAALNPGFGEDFFLNFDVPQSMVATRPDSAFLEVHNGWNAPVAYITISGTVPGERTTTTEPPCIGLPSEGCDGHGHRL
jgi:hypothetical protein